MPKIGLISNPGSERNRRGCRRSSRSSPVTGHHPRRDEACEELDEVLADFARRGVGLLLINGGDGTVQTVLTRSSRTTRSKPSPDLAILPRGMANTTAADVGLRGKAADALSRVIVASRDGGIAYRVVGTTGPAYREPCRRRPNAA